MNPLQTLRYQMRRECGDLYAKEFTDIASRLMKHIQRKFKHDVEKMEVLKGMKISIEPDIILREKIKINK